MPTIDYLPIANGGGANVESQAQYVTDLAGGGSLENGYEAGLAKSVQFNKTMRQSSMIAAALATFISNALGISVLDDGVLSTLVTNLTNAVRSANQAGQCRLSVTSTTALKLSPYGGNHLTINGVSQVIPAAGVSVTNATLAASTLYYVYAFMNAGVLTLEASATGHSTDVATAGNIGIEIKTGDPTRSLVGMVFTDASVHFNDTVVLRNCASWFNRASKSIVGGSVGSSTASAAAVELSTSYRVEVVSWADEAISAYINGTISINSTASSAAAQFGVDGAASGIGGSVTSPVINANEPASAGYAAVLAEGHHTLTIYGSVTGGATATFSPQILGVNRG